MEPTAKLLQLRQLISHLNVLMLILLSLKKKPTFTDCTDELLEPLGQTRLKVALEIELVKRELGEPIHCPQREREELSRLQQLALELELSLSAEEIEAFFQEVFTASRQAQEKQRFAATGLRT